MDDQLKRIAYAAIPSGHYVVKEGLPLPDDLIWSWTTKEWIRADSPDWGPHKTLAEDCVMVIRKAKANARPGSSQRNYSVKRGYETHAVVTNVPSIPDNVQSVPDDPWGQESLF